MCILLYRNLSYCNASIGLPKIRSLSSRKPYATKTEVQNQINEFEPVFSFPYVKYFALLNRLKVYHMFGTSIAVPACGMLETMNIVPQYTFLSVCYVGLTGAAVLSLTSVPFRNIIGHLYISEDDKKIKISSLDFWGKRKDRIVDTDDWIPLLDMEPKTMDALYLSPQLTDGTKYKLFVKLGKVLNAKKIGHVLE